jgi:hypothetical protein
VLVSASSSSKTSFIFIENNFMGTPFDRDAHKKKIVGTPRGHISGK